MFSVHDILSETGPFADCLDGFTVRPQQQQLAQTIAEVLSNDDSLVCEAGTGTGKTFAYLVPVLLSGKRVIISTGTKHLQDQLYYKDLPIVRKALNVPVVTALLKGRANYLCLHRLEYGDENFSYISKEDLSELPMIKQWATQTDKGDLAELTNLPEDAAIRSRIVSSAENCLGQDCSFYDDCFVFKARRKANEAEVIIVNHHLLLADLALRESGFGEVLPKADTIIFDEAHQLPDLASDFFSQTLSSRQFTELFNDTTVAYLTDASDMEEVQDEIRESQTSLRKLRLSFGRKERRSAWNEVFADKEIKEALQDFLDHLITLEKYMDILAERSKSLENCWRRCNNMIEMLQTFMERETEELIQWLETRGQGFLLHQTPLDISAIFQARLAEHGCNCIYTSATLSVAGDFTHFTDQLGLSQTNAQSWSSPFDYQKQALLYLPQGMPEPGESIYTEAVINMALPVIEASQGHAFLLFTSHRAMNEAYRLLAGRIDYPLLRQGDAPRSELLQSFRITKHAVLLGTNSFWEGVDVRGKALSCVIIDKLPFAPPDDPVFRARAAKMQENGQNPFMTYQVPKAVINLKQGVGRLIRDANDYGVLMICDPRLISKAYGKVFLNSLPNMRRSTELADVDEFFFEKMQGDVLSVSK
ncbi:MAG: ATP-dependent DNA helicase [Gammaproteobacteria bacterium]|nr:MAG: ATP-dependent DNA helicase [Gammaproteobacteria bacterium]